jgi:hypothetical protein
MKSILALDVSGKCTGWAFGLPNERPISGIVKWKRKDDTDDEIFARALTWLHHQMRFHSPQIVAIEAPIKSSGFGGTNAASQGMLIGLQGVLRAVVKRNIPGVADLIDVRTARKTFTGRGTYPAGEAKAIVQAEVIRRGFLTPEEAQGDRCDAICLWTHKAAEQNPQLKYAEAIKARPALMEA